jgi:hypothetical protein
MFSITFSVDGPAFDDKMTRESVKVLKRIIRNIEEGLLEGTCHDSLGNCIGEYTIHKD